MALVFAFQRLPACPKLIWTFKNKIVRPKYCLEVQNVFGRPENIFVRPKFVVGRPKLFLDIHLFFFHPKLFLDVQRLGTLLAGWSGVCGDDLDLEEVRLKVTLCLKQKIWLIMKDIPWRKDPLLIHLNL